MKKHLPAVILPMAVSVVLIAISLPAAAHHVHHEVARGEAVVVSLAYGNGSPLAFDRYDIFAGDGETPYQSGKTDAGGRIVFLPDHSGLWRVKVFSEDGHGADFTFEAGPAEAEVTPPDTVGAAEEASLPVDTPPVAADQVAVGKPLIERFAGPVAGVGIIFGVFGLFALFIRRRR